MVVTEVCRHKSVATSLVVTIGSAEADRRGLTAMDGCENARQCVHDVRVLLPPAPHASLPGDCTQSHPPETRSSYHPLPARSNSRRQDPSRGFARPQRRRQVDRCTTRHSRKASDPIRGCSVISSDVGLSRCTSGFGPAMRGNHNRRRWWHARRCRSGSRPGRRAAKKNSPLTGAYTAASTGALPSTSATLTHQSSRPAR